MDCTSRMYFSYDLREDSDGAPPWPWCALPVYRLLSVDVDAIDLTIVIAVVSMWGIVL